MLGDNVPLQVQSEVGEFNLGKSALSTYIRYILAVGFLFILVCTGNLPVTYGQDRVEMSVETGFNGEVKYGSWAPIRITLTNNGSAIQGNVHLDVDRNANDGDWTGTVEAHVDLPQGTTKTLTLLAPSERVQAGQKLVFTADGSKVTEANVRVNQLGPYEMTVGVLSTSPEAGKFLHGLKMGGGNRAPHIYELQPDVIPEVGIGLSSLDVLVLNNFPAETLNVNQVEAVKNWVARGGTLILGGGPGYEKSAQAFQELSPVDVSGTTTIDAVDVFQRQKEYGAELKFTSPLTVSEGTLRPDAKALVAQDGLPIVASKAWREGDVIYTAYNLTAPPIADWNGNAVWWESFLSGSRQYVTQFDRFPWSLRQSVDYNPSLQLPSPGGMAIAFLIYVLLVGPVLYLLLRRFDKRGWAWGVIPLCAVLVAFGVYTYGAEKRSEAVMVHDVQVVKLYPDDFAELRGASAVFVPEGGTYTLRLPNTVFAWPGRSDVTTTTAGDWNDSRVHITPEGTDVTFEKVEFWSLRKAYVEGYVNGGQIAANLTMEGERVVGTVTNETKWDLRDAHVLAGGQMSAIGGLKKGETKQIDVKLDPVPVRHPGLLSRQLLPTAGGKADEFRREVMLLQYLEHEGYHLQPFPSQVQLMGWTEQPVYESTVAGRTSDQYSLSLVIAPLEIRPDKDGKVVYPKGSIIPAVVATSGAVDIMPEGFNILQGTGSVTFRFDLNVEENVTLDKLNVELQGAVSKVEWFNWKAGEWEETNGHSDQSLDEYVSGTGEVLVKVSRDQAGSDQFYPFPVLEAEGKVVR